MSENLFGLTVAADKGLDDLQCQRLLSENRRYQEVMLQYRCALKALESRLEILNEEFSLQHDRNPIESIHAGEIILQPFRKEMEQNGFTCAHLSGGYSFYQVVTKEQQTVRSAYPCGMEKL